MSEREQYILHKLGEYRKRVEKRSQLRTKYGMTLEEYEELLKQQNDVCAICKNPCSRSKTLSVDHCHKTDKNRGLLCNSCNNGLGFFKDTLEYLREAIKYLENHGIS